MNDQNKILYGMIAFVLLVFAATLAAANNEVKTASLLGCDNNTVKVDITHSSATIQCVAKSSTPDNYSGVELFSGFYKPDKTITTAETIEKYTTIILTHKDERYRDRLIADGYKGTMLQYIIGNQVEKQNDCTITPFGNQATYKRGDYCYLRDNKPHWFLKDKDGNNICVDEGPDNKYCIMDPANNEWRSFLVERIKEMQQTYRWSGVFLDNIDGSLYRADGYAKGYNEDTYRDASIDMLAYIRRNINAPLYANLTNMTNDTREKALIHLDGAMLERCIVDWHDGYIQPSAWIDDLNLIIKAQSYNKHIMCVSQGDDSDADRLQFSYASYLLAANGKSSFRYDTEYPVYSWYDIYNKRMGKPLSGITTDNGWYVRTFERGRVMVNPSSRQSKIEYRSN